MLKKWTQINKIETTWKKSNNRKNIRNMPITTGKTHCKWRITTKSRSAITIPWTRCIIKPLTRNLYSYQRAQSSRSVNSTQITHHRTKWNQAAIKYIHRRKSMQPNHCNRNGVVVGACLASAQAVVELVLAEFEEELVAGVRLVLVVLAVVTRAITAFTRSGPMRFDEQRVVGGMRTLLHIGTSVVDLLAIAEVCVRVFRNRRTRNRRISGEKGRRIGKILVSGGIDAQHGKLVDLACFIRLLDFWSALDEQ